jgi:hypothetical protein
MASPGPSSASSPAPAAPPAAKNPGKRAACRASAAARAPAGSCPGAGGGTWTPARPVGTGEGRDASGWYGGGTRRVRLVRGRDETRPVGTGEGRDASGWCGGGTRRVRLVRGKGRDASGWYEGTDETRPVGTGEGRDESGWYGVRERCNLDVDARAAVERVPGGVHREGLPRRAAPLSARVRRGARRN